MINELEIQRYDSVYGTSSRVFSLTNKIVVSNALDDWIIELKEGRRGNNKILLYHKNKYGKTNKYHFQTEKSCLLHAYQTINRHRNCMLITDKCNQCTVKNGVGYY